MEDTLKFIKIACAGLVFCIGMIIFLHGIRTYNKSISTVREKIKDDNVLYQQYYPDEEIVTYSELIASLFQILEYDIEIDGFLINKYEHFAEKVISYNIQETDYSKSYLYDANGNVTKIVYTPVN